MLLVISPAKTLDYSNPEYSSHTQLDFPAEVKDLVGVLKKKIGFTNFQIDAFERFPRKPE